jgi:stearoyl-CoA desaturase (delta-9 desaturase)
MRRTWRGTRFIYGSTPITTVPLIVLGLILLATGGIQMVLWGVFLRVVVGLHATWLVNSATHMWGNRRFATRDDSRNSWWVALLTFGEGWHNNHHAHPTSARHGLAWYELDITWLQIRALQLVGIARSVKVAKVSERMVEQEAA